MKIRRPVAFLDASVLYPALLRNILLRLARQKLYEPRWTKRVHDEWTNALLRDRPDLSQLRVERTRFLMEAAFEQALVTGYEASIDSIVLPDLDDRHVLAAALHCRANIVVTANLKDFPADLLRRRDIEAQHPDAFICGLFELEPEAVLAAVTELRASLKNPVISAPALLEAMARQNLAAAADKLSSFVGDI